MQVSELRREEHAAALLQDARLEREGEPGPGERQVFEPDELEMGRETPGERNENIRRKR